jgi:hypothetical protein
MKDSFYEELQRVSVKFPKYHTNIFDPGVNWASNRNEYQESSWGVKGGRYLRLTTSAPSVS